MPEDGLGLHAALVTIANGETIVMNTLLAYALPMLQRIPSGMINHKPYLGASLQMVCLRAGVGTEASAEMLLPVCLQETECMHIAKAGENTCRQAPSRPSNRNQPWSKDISKTRGSVLIVFTLNHNNLSLFSRVAGTPEMCWARRVTVTSGC